jgi:uncharacterized protein with FMN-binding domain
MKKIIKWGVPIFLILIVIMMIFAFLGKDETLNLEIQTIDMAKISDGTYTGNYDCYRWSNKVEVTVKNHQITDIVPIKVPSGRDALVKALTQKILNKQSPDVDAVSGATASSKGFQKAVELALKSAKDN